MEGVEVFLKLGAAEKVLKPLPYSNKIKDSGYGIRKKKIVPVAIVPEV